jgi:hypothetical protein
MIKSWSKFNENVDGLRDQLSEKLSEVRDVFSDFEDLDIITYTIVPSGYERGDYINFDPQRGDFDRFMDNITPIVQLGISKDNIGSITKYKVTDKDFCIIANIKLMGETNAFKSTVLNNDGIKLFEDILIANSRLIDMGFDVKLDLNGNHPEYKPTKFLIYFDLK